MYVKSYYLQILRQCLSIGSKILDLYKDVKIQFEEAVNNKFITKNPCFGEKSKNDLYSDQTYENQMGRNRDCKVGNTNFTLKKKETE